MKSGVDVLRLSAVGCLKLYEGHHTQTIIADKKDGMMYTTLCAKVVKEFPNIKDIQIEWIS
ncbi:hypothetical protein [Bacillus sp. S10(2024)]|uniref:hypothetical protein n=1 Tax=Bacillus sp. S10(2024) TaxID=3162886 RepID=UPI003D1971A3